MARSRQDKPAPAAIPERLLQAKLPADLVKALRMLALERDTTVKELLTVILREYLAKQRPGPTTKG